MSTLKYLRWEYRWNRAIHGPIKSALLAIKVALTSLPF